MSGKKVVAVRNFDFVSKPGYSWFRRHWLHFRYSRMLRKADLVVVPSQKVADDAVKYYFVPKERIRIGLSAADESESHGADSHLSAEIIP